MIIIIISIIILFLLHFILFHFINKRSCNIRTDFSFLLRKYFMARRRMNMIFKDERRENNMDIVDMVSWKECLYICTFKF